MISSRGSSCSKEWKKAKAKSFMGLFILIVLVKQILLFDNFNQFSVRRMMSIQQNKTLVIILGSLRGGEKTWKTLYEEVLDLNSADLALVVGEVDERNASLYQRAKYIWEFQEWEDWADAIDLIDEKSNWRESILPRVDPIRGLLGGVKGYRGSGAIIFMARHFASRRIKELGLTKKYDRFVVTRSDHFYKCAHDLSSLDPRFIWVPDGENYFGVTDRHVVCPSAYILGVLDILDSIIKDPEEYGDLIDKAHNPESLIKMRWDQQGLFQLVRRFKRMMFTCGVPGDETRWLKMSSTMVPEGVFLKYGNEYVAANKTCQTGINV